MKRCRNKLFGPKNGTNMPDKTDPQATILHTAHSSSKSDHGKSSKNN